MRNRREGMKNTICVKHITSLQIRGCVGVLVFLTSKSTSKVIPAMACWTRTVKNCSTEASTLPAHTRINDTHA